MSSKGYVSREMIKPAVRPPDAPAKIYVPREHPICTKDYVIPSDAIFDLEEFMQDAIDLGLDGSIIFGSAYAGKSFAVMEIAKRFQKEKASDFLTYRITLSEKTYKYKEFFQYLSEQIGCNLPVKTTDANRVVENFLSSIVQRARRHNNTVVLILDEVESLDIEHYGYLKFVYNRLREEGVSLMTFLVGTDVLLNTKESFENSGSAGEQITRRFMQGIHQFNGIYERDQLQYVLSGYDNLTYGGETFTQHYFPIAWAKGARLSDLTDDMMAVMLEISGLPKIPEIPMGYMTRVINALFLTFGVDTNKTDGRGNSLQKEWISRSDIENVMIKQDIDRKLIELGSKSHRYTLRKGGKS